VLEGHYADVSDRSDAPSACWGTGIDRPTGETVAVGRPHPSAIRSTVREHPIGCDASGDRATVVDGHSLYAEHCRAVVVWGAG